MLGFILDHRRATCLAALGALLVGFVGLGFTIGRQVDRAVRHAQSFAPGEPVEALTALAVSDRAPLKERNRAIWALGQLGAPEAVPALEALVSGTGCDHDRIVCQRELAKAITACSGSFNLGAVVWRHGELASR